MKILKLAFAMGGGVSLGTFSGAALTECIKQLLIQGGIRDKNGNFTPFDNIELDVFSGASAGAISLAIMLRMLIGYEDKITLLSALDKYKNLKNVDAATFKTAIRSNLEKELAGRVLSDEKMEQLIGVQVAQDFEELLWCRRVDIDGLAGLGSDENMKQMGSFLDAGFLKKLANEAIWPSEKEGLPIIPNAHTVLNKRVLFVNSLTRIEHREINAVPNVDEDQGKKLPFFDNEETLDFYNDLVNKVLSQGMSSRTHKDLRVFDIDLEPTGVPITDDNNYPNRWVYSCNHNALAKHHQDIHQDKHFKVTEPAFWQAISLTSLAAGAFPFAFEPVKLKRFQYETQEAEDKEYHYIDGGTFNNEPIREAFRLSGFLDDLDKRDAKDYQRIIIYVDPFINESASFDAHKIFSTKNELTGGEKITGFFPHFIAMMRQEGAIVEMDKTIGVLDKFNGLNALKRFYAQTVQKGIGKRQQKDFEEEEKKDIKEELLSLIKLVKRRIKKLRKEMTIPTNLLNFENAIKRAIINDANEGYFTAKDLIQQLKEGKLEQEGTPVRTDYEHFFGDGTISNPFNARYFTDWLTAMFIVASEVVTDLSGKDEDRFVLPIEPIDIHPVSKEITSIPLEGMPLEGFMGFLDERLRNYDFNVGKDVAKNILAALNMIEERTITPVTTPPKRNKKAIALKAHQVITKRTQTDELLVDILPKGVNRSLKKIANFIINKLVLSRKKIRKRVEAIYKSQEDLDL